VENSTWNIRLFFYVEKWSSSGQIIFNVESTSKFTLRLVRGIFTSNRRRFYVGKYLCGLVYFSTSNQRRFNLKISLSTRTVDSSTSSIRRFHVDASPKVFVDFSTLNARRFYVDFSQSIRPVDSSTLNIRRIHVEVSPR